MWHTQHAHEPLMLLNSLRSWRFSCLSLFFFSNMLPRMIFLEARQARAGPPHTVLHRSGRPLKG